MRSAGRGCLCPFLKNNCLISKLETKDSVKEGIVPCLGECKDDREELQISSTGAA